MNYYNSLPVLLLISCNEFSVKSRPDLVRISQDLGQVVGRREVLFLGVEQIKTVLQAFDLV